MHGEGCECPTCCMSEGGEVGVHKSSMEERSGKWAGESKAGSHVKNMDISSRHKDMAKEEHHKVLGEMMSMKKPNLQGLAEGGEVKEDRYADLVDRIMDRRMSEGGEVANDTEILADFMPNEFDNLSLNDDLESNYTGKNSGDELGNKREDMDREDIVSRVMKSRRKKDRMPSPA